MKGRYIGENIRLIFELLDTTDENNIPGLLLFSDFEKAFDSVNHEFMYKCLEHFNFGNELINWVKLFYNDAKSCVSNNGNLSDFYKVQRGVRQGCPLSPYLFIICIELLRRDVPVGVPSDLSTPTGMSCIGTYGENCKSDKVSKYRVLLVALQLLWHEN